MTQRQENSVTMFKAIISLFHNSKSIWQDTKPVKESFTKLQNILNHIENIDSKLDNNQTSDDSPLKKQLAEKTYSLALKLKAYAKKSGNEILKKTIDLSLNSLDANTDQQLLNLCRTIHSKGVEFKTATAAYKITDVVLTDLQTLIDAYKPLSANGDAIADQHSRATDQLEQLFTQARSILDLLDDEVEALIEDDIFVISYHEARKITDRKRRSENKAVEVAV